MGVLFVNCCGIGLGKATAADDDDEATDAAADDNDQNAADVEEGDSHGCCGTGCTMGSDEWTKLDRMLSGSSVSNPHCSRTCVMFASPPPPSD